MPTDNLSADPKSEARTLKSLGGVERLVNICDGGRRHARAGIGDGDGDTAPFVPWVRRFTGANEQAAALSVHGMYCIGNEISEDLADFTHHADDVLFRPISKFDLDVVIFETRPIDLKNGGEKLFAGDGFWPVGLF